MKRNLVTLMLLAVLSVGCLGIGGCVVEAPRPPPPGPGCVWVPGHWGGPYGNVWIRAHWRCPP